MRSCFEGHMRVTQDRLMKWSECSVSVRCHFDAVNEVCPNCILLYHNFKNKILWIFI